MFPTKWGDKTPIIGTCRLSTHHTPCRKNPRRLDSGSSSIWLCSTESTLLHPSFGFYGVRMLLVVESMWTAHVYHEIMQAQYTGTKVALLPSTEKQNDINHDKFPGSVYSGLCYDSMSSKLCHVRHFLSMQNASRVFLKSNRHWKLRMSNSNDPPSSTFPQLDLSPESIKVDVWEAYQPRNIPRAIYVVSRDE